MEIEKDEEEFQRIAYTLPSLSPKREKIQMKKSFLKSLSETTCTESVISKVEKKKKKQNKTITKLAHLNNKV